YLPARMIMSYDPVTCAPMESAGCAVKKMTEYGVKRLPVVDDGKLLGCIEKIDVLEALYSEADLDFNQLRNYIFKTGGRYLLRRKPGPVVWARHRLVSREDDFPLSRPCHPAQMSSHPTAGVRCTLTT